MDAVILFSHGSVLCGAGETLQAHAARLQAQGVAPVVEIGYLNYSEPPFVEAAARCIAAGANRLLVMPYFLVPGYFIKVEMPRTIEAAQTAHPGVTFVVAEPIGFDTRLADALIESAFAAAPPSEWRADRKRAPFFCRDNPACPLYDTPDCPHSALTPRPPLPGTGEGEGQNQTSPPSLARNERPGKDGGGSGLIALFVMVHGSPRPIANEEMFRVVEVVRKRGLFPVVEVGFMECNAPTIPEAIDACAAQGAERILAVPYFLHTGKHVADDLPTLLEQGRERHPNIAFRMGDYLGRSERLTEILADRIRAIP
jgi:sirohydrochlorin cobaltochelatase